MQKFVMFSVGGGGATPPSRETIWKHPTATDTARRHNWEPSLALSNPHVRYTRPSSTLEEEKNGRRASKKIN